MNSEQAAPRRRKLRLPDFDYSQPGGYFVTIVTQDRKSLFGQILEGEMVLNEIGEMIQAVIEEIPQHYQGVNVEAFVVMPNHIHVLFLFTDEAAPPHSNKSVGAGPHVNKSVGAGPRACPSTRTRASETDQPNAGQPQGVDPTEKHRSLTVADPPDDDLVGAGPRACPSTAPHASQSVHSKTGQPQGVDPTQAHFSLPEIVHRLKSLTTHRYIDGVKNNNWPRFDTRLWQRNYYEHIIRNEKDFLAVNDYILANPMNWEKDEEYLPL